MSNQRHAETAEAAAVFLAEHADLPDVACTEVVANRTETVTRWQLSAQANELADLVTWADALDGEVSATVLRRERPNAFVGVEITGNAAGTPVIVWTHLGESDISALWAATGHEPEPGIRAHLSLDTLRAAAESTQDAEVPA